MQLTKEDRKILKKYEEFLKKVHNSHTASGYTDDIFTVLYGIYYRIYKKHQSSVCNHCKMVVAMAIAKLYFQNEED